MDNMITVIVPIFNVEEYLSECLESLKNQTYSNCEFILVDNGSTDASVEIANRFSREDLRFVLYRTEKHGASVARNIGLENSEIF